MTEVIVSPTEQLDKSQADLICPQPECRAGLYFSSAARRLACPVCGWTHQLTAGQHADLVDAIAGITDLNVPAYLLNLHVSEEPPSPDGGSFPRRLARGWAALCLGARRLSRPLQVPVAVPALAGVPR